MIMVQSPMCLFFNEGVRNVRYLFCLTAETTENASATTNAPTNTTTASGRKGALPKTHKLHKTTAAPSKKRATTAAPAKKTTKAPPKKGKNTTKAPEKATKATRIAQHQSHRKSDSLRIYIPSEFDNVIMNETLVKEFTDCFLDRGPCNPAAKDIKGKYVN